ncbi:MAG: tetratricopeptide repeat protein, partial [Terriglobia bacterium]
RWYADFLCALGRAGEALEEMERALQLDPLSLIISTEISWISYLARDVGRAVDQALKTLEMEPEFYPACHILGLAYEQIGDNKKAVRALEKASRGSGGNPISLAALGHAYAAAGRKREAKKTLGDLRNYAKSRYVPPYGFAILHAGLGESSQALAWLQTAHEHRDVWLMWMQRDPRLDLLRREPLFQSLSLNMGFPGALGPSVS